MTVMTHVKALQAGHSSQGTSEPITPVLSTSTFAGLGRDSLIYNGGAPPYAGLWPALSGHIILTSSHFNSYPVRDS